jgi:hypothetical protein
MLVFALYWMELCVLAITFMFGHLYISGVLANDRWLPLGGA